MLLKKNSDGCMDMDEEEFELKNYIYKMLFKILGICAYMYVHCHTFGYTYININIYTQDNQDE